MNVSVVLAVETPDSCLATLLSALRRQSHRAFEVVLVTGPHADAPFASLVKVVQFPHWTAARAKNAGAAHAAGEVVAFLDPGCVPDVDWLAELVAGYTAEQVGAVGGPVANTADAEPCFRADRLGNLLDAVPSPYWAYQIPYADPYVCLHAGNCSFRRATFLAAGGFDEALGDACYQADLCMRLTDGGHLVQPSPRPVVYSSRLRHEQAADAGDRDRADWERIALAAQRRTPAPSAIPFLAYPTVDAQAVKLTLGFTTTGFPPTASDPCGRHTWNLARGLAERGHEVHLFAAAGGERTDFEQGVWVHRLDDGRALHRAVTDLSDTRPLDLLVTAGTEGLACVLDRTLNSALHLRPTLRMQPEWDDTLPLEHFLLQSAPQVIVPGAGLLRRVRRQHGVPFPPTPIFMCPPAVRDPSQLPNGRGSDRLVPRLLFVGSLHAEHGADLFLRAAETLVREGHDFEVVLTGDGDTPSDAGPSYRVLLQRGDAALRRRVLFLGELSEDGLARALADCGVVCLPYRVDSAVVPCLEALSFGRAVVAADHDSTREILDDGSTGLLCRRGDGVALTERLRELLTDEEMRRRLGRQGRRSYETRFHFDRVVETTLATYTSLVAAAGLEGTAA
jgi:glycosyltransferase involved in cell wall biosynthesis